MSTQTGEHYSFFVDQSETALATIGSNYLQNYLTFGKVDKGIGVLTEKRFYYKGKGFAGSGKHLFSATREGLVSIEDMDLSRKVQSENPQNVLHGQAA